MESITNDSYWRDLARALPTVPKLEMTAQVLEQLLVDVESGANTTSRMSNNWNSSRSNHHRRSSSNSSYSSSPVSPSSRTRGAASPRYARTPMELAKLMNRRPASTQRLAPLALSSSPELPLPANPPALNPKTAFPVQETDDGLEAPPPASTYYLPPAQFPVYVHAPRPIHSISLHAITPPSPVSPKSRGPTPHCQRRRTSTSSTGSSDARRSRHSVRVKADNGHEQPPVPKLKRQSIIRANSMSAADSRVQILQRPRTDSLETLFPEGISRTTTQ
ncbi:hypothetical protein MIND_01157400 [Mycena indigotica]|uniref:Uncharacterized protein n=1 Tax=Mycena indigotica TaxID=2126181 RepID=A0A8H6S4E1_9AGAR|nr:uncharacterized protein MIND_01157400 [Mycena indigotica]KAF7292596.1 hypothetical protein MIND_01157400 [Mycena indigotica]